MLKKLINLNLARVNALVTQKSTAAIFHQISFYLLSFFENNKLFYKANKLSCSKAFSQVWWRFWTYCSMQCIFTENTTFTKLF